ncbi:MAG: SDR family NAD(P)-dependent oxidoreductase [Syntrophomonadaceae bacterium]
MKPFEGKYALITGAGSGIGRDTALLLAERGAKGIIIADLNLDSAVKAAEEITTATGCECLPFKVDVSIPSEIEALFAFAGEKFGTIHILVNSAGVLNYLSIDEVNVDVWDKTLNINLRGTYLCAREALKYMKAQNYGKIINVSSSAGRIGGIAAGIDYTASKGGVIAMTYSLAKLGAAHNINVNGVAPGIIETPLSKNRPPAPGVKVGLPRDVSTAIVFLASDEANHITGCTLDINGGTYMH